MRNKIQKKLLTTALAIGLGSVSAAQAADVILFDPDGGGSLGSYSVGAFDWTVSSALADNALTSPSSFNLFFHASLGGLIRETGSSVSPSGLNDTFEITIIGGFREALTVTSTTTSVNFGANGVLGGGDDIYTVTQSGTLAPVSGAESFLRMYYDPFSTSGGSSIASNALSGLGFNDGQEILSASISTSSGSIAVTQQFSDLNDNGSIDGGELIEVLLDGFGPDNWAGQLTATASGSTSLVASILSYDTSFFLTPLSQFLQDVDFTTETKLAFAQTNPSKSFNSDTSGGTVSLSGGGLTLGTVNSGFLSGAGSDIILQADASNSFVAATVPEPSILGLLGLGLMGLAFSSRRRKHA